MDLAIPPNRDAFRIDIKALEAIVKDVGQEPELPIQHNFAPGVYARTMCARADSLIIGKIHKHAHLNMLLAGSVRVVTEHGSQILTAPCVFTSEPGTQRVGYVLEDLVWTCIHPTDEKDVEKIVGVYLKQQDQLEKEHAEYEAKIKSQNK